MATSKNVKDVKKLLSAGLTGWEAGLLVLQDSWEVDHKRPGILGPGDLEALKRGLRTQQDTHDYNLLVDLYRVIDYIERSALTRIMVACYNLERVWGIGNWLFGAYMAEDLFNHMPLIVTEKELKDLKAKQKRARLKTLHCLAEVIHERAEALAPEEWGGICYSDDEEDGDSEVDQLLRQAEKEIRGMISAGKLPKPVKLDIKASDAEEGNKETIEPWNIGPWTEEEEYIQRYISGADLCKAKLPEWIEDMDTFYPFRIDREDWIDKRATECPPDDVAVVQSTFGTDKKGYYRPPFLGPGYAFGQVLKESPVNERLQNTCLDHAKEAKEAIEEMVANRTVLRELEPALGLKEINLCEGIDYCTETILEPSLGRYNQYSRDWPPILEKYFQGLQKYNNEVSKALDEISKEEKDRGSMAFWTGFARDFRQLPILQLEKIRPPAKKLSEIRSWVSAWVGNNWWKSPLYREEETDGQD